MIRIFCVKVDISSTPDPESRCVCDGQKQLKFSYCIFSSFIQSLLEGKLYFE